MEERQHCSKVVIDWINMFLRLSVEDVSEIVCLGDVSEIVCLGDELELGSIQHVSEIFIGRWGVERQVLETPSELRADMNR